MIKTLKNISFTQDFLNEKLTETGKNMCQDIPQVSFLSVNDGLIKVIQNEDSLEFKHNYIEAEFTTSIDKNVDIEFKRTRKKNSKDIKKRKKSLLKRDESDDFYGKEPHQERKKRLNRERQRRYRAKQKGDLQLSETTIFNGKTELNSENYSINFNGKTELNLENYSNNLNISTIDEKHISSNEDSLTQRVQVESAGKYLATAESNSLRKKHYSDFHIQKINIGEEKKQCNECGFILTGEKKLLDHMIETHSRIFRIVNKIIDDPQSFELFKCTVINEKGFLTENESKKDIYSGDQYKKYNENNLNKSVLIDLNSMSNTSLDFKRCCGTCGLVLSCEDLLLKHIEAKHQNYEDNIEKIETRDCENSFHSCEKKIPCPFCSETFSISMIGFHVWSIHKQNFNKCSSCHLIFNSFESLKNHCILVKTEKEIYTFLIEMQNEFADVGDHYKFPNGAVPLEKKRLFKCKCCRFVGESPNTVLRHFIVLHMRPYECPHTCGFCDFRSKSDEGIRKHLFSMHPESKADKYICDNCGYVTYNKRTFFMHIRNHNRYYKCEFCDYTTSLHTSIVVHRRRHTKQKPYKCDFEGCDYSSVQKSSLTTHRFTHEPEKYSQYCHICGFKTVNKYIMNSHMREHAKGADVYSCLQCSFTTKHKLALKMHYIVHKEADKCLLCMFTTKYEYTMRKHMKAKHGIDVPIKTAGMKPKNHPISIQ